ncbi:expressed unknown protein [Seminavis robusta]|uniref:Uncharacterized protein n=1 Tax=Seminavis robusta TaxID=568900 RepID=A0A9N8DAL5_9STRA|nr:expressed unknown protein [Seminavis robusta]|eukprot:Sro16_g011870.1 n/a (288) ;mRNA; f:150430-151293
MMDLNDMVDAVGYKDWVLSETGLGDGQIQELARDEDFRESPEYQAIMDAVDRHSTELQELTQVFTACKEEVEGSVSAVGTGAMVGTFLAGVMEEPIILDRSPSGPPHFNATTRTPTKAPSVVSAEASPKMPTSAPVTLKGPVCLVGLHLQAGLIIDAQISFFIGGGTRDCIGYQFGPGAEVSLILMYVSGNVQANFCMFELELGLGPHVGTAFGGGTGFDVFEVTIGGGVGFGIGTTYYLQLFRFYVRMVRIFAYPVQLTFARYLPLYWMASRTIPVRWTCGQSQCS